MPSSANVNSRIIARIQESGQSFTVVYPAARPVATGTAPGSMPISPLTGADDAEVVFKTEPTPYQSSLTLKCLWHDVATTDELSDRTSAEKYQFEQLGWVRGATALARVLVSEAALDITNPYAGTKLDASDHIMYYGRRFRVLQTSIMGSGLGTPVSYHVWLEGNQR